MKPAPFVLEEALKLPKTRTDARAKGSTYFFTRVPCKKGHTELRRTSSSKCRQCERDDCRKSDAKYKEDRRERSRRDYQKDRDRRIARARKWQVDNPEKFKASSGSWAKNNPERALSNQRKRRAGKRDKINALAREWRKTNGWRFAAYNAGKKKGRRNSVPPWLTKQQKKQISAFYREAEKLTAVTGVKHHVDHIYPIKGKTSCGLHVPWNLQVITWGENLRKGAKTPEEYAAYLAEVATYDSPPDPRNAAPLLRFPQHDTTLQILELARL